MFRLFLITNILFFSFTSWGQFNLEDFEVAGKGTVNLPAAGDEEPMQSEISLDDGLTFQISVYRFSEAYVYFSDAQLKNEDGYMSLDGFAIDSKSVDIDFQEYMEKNLVLKPTQKFVPMTNENSGFVAGELLDSTQKSLDIQIKILNLRTDLTRDQAKALFENDYFMPKELLVNRFKISHISSSGYHNCAIVNKRVKCWGYGGEGQLGYESTSDVGARPEQMGDSLGYVDLGKFEVQQLASSSNFNCALSADGLVKCWGGNEYGQLGLGDRNSRGHQANTMGDRLPLVDLGTDAKVSQLAISGRQVCALIKEKGVKCWGNNGSGQLGLGDRVRRGGQPNQMGDNLPYVDLGTQAKPVKLAAGWDHNCALFDNGRVKCWGSGIYLGLGVSSAKGDQAGEMGDDLPFVDLGSEKTTDISSFVYFTCALLESGRIKCWGRNNQGQLGLEDTNHRGDNPNEMGDNLPYINLGTKEKVIGIDAGYNSTCAIFESGRMKCWGSNSNGQLGLGDRIRRGDRPGTMGINLPFVDIGSEKIMDVQSGWFFNCALDSTWRTKCWGENTYGQIGVGHQQSIGGQAGEMGEALKYVDLGPSLEFD